MPLSAFAQRTHRAEAFGTGAAQQLEQHGFGLVAAMLGESEEFAVTQGLRKRGMARAPRGIFQPGSGGAIHAHGDDLQRYFQTRGEIAAVPRPSAAVVVQSVIDMDRACSKALESTPPLKATASGPGGSASSRARSRSVNGVDIRAWCQNRLRRG
jgi:hypothetical protein